MSFSPCNWRPGLSRKRLRTWGERGEGKHEISGMQATQEITWEENIRTFLQIKLTFI